MTLKIIMIIKLKMIILIIFEKYIIPYQERFSTLRDQL